MEISRDLFSCTYVDDLFECDMYFKGILNLGEKESAIEKIGKTK